ncbi:GDP-fucose protein O-fucosyltransferase 2 isoform X2 [Orussus abietinus]|nr:GDP-fucose protein O-fucosyltransferase 2 isoform X2 [Orussus abietinus]XP_012289251.1 GDP-fucose protein O-fucosyltransferase 2 isoform X2 [Orussus abietinus]
MENGSKCTIQRHFSKKRYILYDVNPPEGFNLRRDVYIRAAVFVKDLAEQDNEFDWQLVLPPWEKLYHWKSRDLGSQLQIPWGTFFDIESLRKFAPVIEMYDFLKEYPSEHGTTIVDKLYILQNDEEMFKTGKFEDKNEVVKCLSDSQQRIVTWGYSNISMKEVSCLTFHATVSGLRKNLQPKIYSSVAFDHMEVALHDSYGSQNYWRARRSMRYNSELYEIAKKFREQFLHSNDVKDQTIRSSDWTKEKGERNALGGPYLAVHLRRRDFLIGRSKFIPTIPHAAVQLKEIMVRLGLNVTFVATDAEEHEYSELQKHLPDYKILKFQPSWSIRKKFKDGGIAIIDQIICSHARYFIGTYESTFTFRIQEDREILGFPTETTFNVLCGKEKKCLLGGHWKIVW